MNSSEELIRQYVREALIAERKGRADVRRRGQEVGVGVTPDVLGWLRSMKDMFGHFWNAIKGLVYTGTAAYKGAESVFKIGAEGLQGVVGGKTPDYDSIITNQAATMRKMRDWTGIERMPTLGQRIGLTNEKLDLSLRNMSLSILLEQIGDIDPSAEVDPEASEIVDAAVQAASSEIQALPVDSSEMIPSEPEEVPEPSLDPALAQEIGQNMSQAAQADVANIMRMHQRAVNATTLPEAVSAISTAMGRPVPGDTFSPEALSQRVTGLTGESLTPQDVQAGSQDLMAKVKSLIPTLFTSVLGGSLDRVLSDVTSEPIEVQEAVKNAVMPPYNQAIEIVNQGL